METWFTLQNERTRSLTTATTNTNLTMIHSHAECGHIFTTYILPDIFHFIAFIIGFIHFRITEGEQMYSLMEKVSIIYIANIIYFKRIY